MIRRTLIFSFLLALLTGPLGLFAESPRTVDPYELEAAYLVHFLEFVDWPVQAFTDEKAPYVIGILGEDPFGETLDRLVRGRLFQGRSVEVRRFGTYDEDDMAGLRDCHILFVSDSEKDSLPVILKRIRKDPVLTVSEIDKFLLFGGILGFDLEGKKIKLFFNPKAAKNARLKVSARLEQVCKTYHED